MIHKLNLDPIPFNSICAGKKTVEMRLYDEKRSKISVGDQIEFENTNTHLKIYCLVMKISRFKDFFELYSNFDKKDLGYDEGQTADANDMYAYYSPEKIAKYGALAIEIKLI